MKVASTVFTKGADRVGRGKRYAKLLPVTNCHYGKFDSGSQCTWRIQWASTM